jgi:hypothetical protein
MNEYKSPTREEAYRILNRIHETRGQGIVVSHLATGSDDPSLYMATHPFLTADTATASWAAVLIEEDFAEALLKAHPKGKIVRFRFNPPGTEGENLCLFIQNKAAVGETDNSLAWWTPWIGFDDDFRSVVLSIIAFKETRNRERILAALLSTQRWIGQDRILESLFWYRKAQYHHRQVVESFFNKNINGKIGRNAFVTNEANLRLDALQRSLECQDTRLVRNQFIETQEITRRLMKRERAFQVPGVRP